VLLQLIEAGLRRGECSPNDITIEYTKDECKVIGAVFKLLKRFGFVQLDQRIKNTNPASNGRKVHVWELQNRYKAELYVKHLRKELISQTNDEPQLTLWRGDE